MKKLYALLTTSLISGILLYNANATNHGSAQAEVLTSIINTTIVSNPNIGRFYRTNPESTARIIMHTDETIITTNATHKGGHNKGEVTVQAASNTALHIGNVQLEYYDLTNHQSGDVLRFTPMYSLNRDDYMGPYIRESTDENGNIRFYIGGFTTIAADVDPAPGIYSGSFNISVVHQ